MHKLTVVPARGRGYFKGMILSVGLDLELLRIRNAVLKSAGFELIESSSVEDGLRLFRRDDILLVILCHTIPATLRRSTTIMMKHEKSQTAVLALHHAFDFIEEADVSLDNLSGPGELLDCVAALLRKPPRSEYDPHLHQAHRKGKTLN